MRLPCGDQFGCTPSLSDRTRYSPVVAFTIHIRLGKLVRPELSTLFSAKTISCPSGDQAGLYPKSVSGLGDSPVMLITQMPPPPSRVVRRKAMRLPSGDRAGWVSCASELSVRFVVLREPTLLK